MEGKAGKSRQLVGRYLCQMRLRFVSINAALRKKAGKSKLQWQKQLEERKKFLLSVQSVREIENCRLSSSFEQEERSKFS